MITFNTRHSSTPRIPGVRPEKTCHRRSGRFICTRAYGHRARCAYIRWECGGVVRAVWGSPHIPRKAVHAYGLLILDRLAELEGHPSSRPAVLGMAHGYGVPVASIRRVLEMDVEMCRKAVAL